MRRSAIKQYIANPRPLHHIQLHRTATLSDATCDFQNCLDDFGMVKLARIAKTLRKIVGGDSLG